MKEIYKDKFLEIKVIDKFFFLFVLLMFFELMMNFNFLYVLLFILMNFF